MITLEISTRELSERKEQDPLRYYRYAHFMAPAYFGVEILMGISVYTPLRSALSAGPPDLQRPHTLDFGITDAGWLTQ